VKKDSAGNIPPEWGRVNPGATAAIDVRPRLALEFRPSYLGPILIEILGGPMDGLRKSISRSECLIGRAEDNDLCLGLDPTVSSHHARLIRSGGECWLEDLQSRNGTLVSGEQVLGRRLLAPGALMTIGCTTIEFMPH